MVMDSQNAITICYVNELFTFIYHLYEHDKLNTLMWQFVDGKTQHSNGGCEVYPQARLHTVQVVSTSFLPAMICCDEVDMAPQI